MSRPLIIGHRGASALAPENTLTAFERALADGADGIEFDVRLSRDMAPVVIHDADLKRTAGRPERVKDLSADELGSIDVGSWFNSRNPQSADESFGFATVPKLDAVFEMVRKADITLYVELKPDPSDRQQLVDAVRDLIKDHSLEEQVIIESFDLETIALMKKSHINLKTAALFEPRFSRPRPSVAALVHLARKCGADEMALHHALATSRRVARFHQEGFPVVVWTVDNPAWVSKAVTLGVKALISNNPGLLRATLSPNAE